MQPYVSSDQNLREFSLRAVLIGLVLAVVLMVAAQVAAGLLRESSGSFPDCPLPAFFAHS